MVECRGLTKRYGQHTVLDGIDLQVGSGERVALFGLNGAGKTTLLRCVLGLARFEGEVLIDGVGPGIAARKKLAYVPQRPPRFDLSLQEFLDVFAGLRGLSASRVKDRVSALGLDVSAYATRRLDDLSGGMLQKTVVALALETDAPLLLLDEPTANLDADSRAELLGVLRDAAADRTLIVSSHRFEDVITLAERAIVLDRGRIAFDGDIAELQARGDVHRELKFERPGADLSRALASIAEERSA